MLFPFVVSFINSPPSVILNSIPLSVNHCCYIPAVYVRKVHALVYVVAVAILSFPFWIVCHFISFCFCLTLSHQINAPHAQSMRGMPANRKGMISGKVILFSMLPRRYIPPRRRMNFLLSPSMPFRVWRYVDLVS